MDEQMIYVPYGDFVDGVTARADLDSIRAIITEGKGYCSDTIMAVLGLPVKKEEPFGREHTEGEK
mgnify:CR=1 FL=1